MIFFYKIFTNIFFPIFILVIFFRKFFNKEHKKRYKEKFVISSQLSRFKLENKKIIWIHTASIGEMNSITPIVNKLTENNKEIYILITSITLSSSQIFEKNFRDNKSVYHHFLPLDVSFLIEKFLNYLKPEKVIFVDSEIWPNTLRIIKSKKIPLILLNARISNKTLKRWKMIGSFSKKIFSFFDLCLASSNESLENLKDLGSKNVKFFGNIKFCVNFALPKNQKYPDILKNKKVWCAASTHSGEEIICIKTHLELKKKYELITIIIPRHINRVQELFSLSKDHNLKVQLTKNFDKINEIPDIIIINSFGDIAKYFHYCKSVFIGKSLPEKFSGFGGQNPIEPAKFGCKIYHGPHVSNFKEIYKYLENMNIAFEIKNEKDLIKNLDHDFSSEKKIEFGAKELNEYGNKILDKTINEIQNF